MRDLSKESTDVKNARVETGQANVAILSEESWKKRRSEVRREGLQVSNTKRTRGQVFDVQILAPWEMKGGDSVPLAGVNIALDWKITTKLEIVSAARDIITKAYFLGSLDPSLPTVLASVIEEKGLYEYGIGEFFLLYGRFEQKHGLARSEDTKAKMMDLLNGDQKYLKPYINRGKQQYHPLPFAVRNILSHVGNNPNTLDSKGDELRTAIDLLKSWLK